MTHRGIIKAHEQFLRELVVGRIISLAFTPSIVAKVEEVFRKLPSTIFMRAGDAIHLMTARENGYEEIYSNDRLLLAAAPLFNLKGVNPLGKQV